MAENSGTFSQPELVRYSRHILLKEVGSAGQQKLKAARVLVVGAGGLGSPALLYLAAAGVGTLGLIDHDKVDLSNLQRQVIYTDEDLGKFKASSAAARLQKLNGEISVIAYSEKLNAANAENIISNYDIVIDGSDNFNTRYLVNDACVLLGKTNIYGAVFRFEGQVSLFQAPGPCYRCLYATAPPAEAIANCAEGGVLGVLPGVIGMLQATETIKWILGVGEPLTGRLLLFDGLSMSFDELTIERNKACAICGDKPAIKSLLEEKVVCASTSDMHEEAISAQSLAALLEQKNPPLLLDVRSGEEYLLGNLPGSRLLPLDEIEERLDTLEEEKTRTIVVYCKSGARSRKAMDILRLAGFSHVRHLTGGIISWKLEIDPAITVT